MPKRQITEDALRALAGLSGLELSGDQLAELLPQVQRSVEAIDQLDALELENVEPAFVFDPERG